MAPPVPAGKFIDNPLAPEFFCAGATGFLVLNGNIIITFENGRVDHTTSPGPVNRVVVTRIVIPIPGAQGLAVGLYDFLEKNGLGPPKPETKDVQ